MKKPSWKKDWSQVGTRLCKTCLKTLPIKYMAKDGVRKRYKCKICTNEYKRIRRRLNPIGYAARDRRYTIKNAEKRNAYSDNYSWFIKYTHKIVLKAVKSGELIRQPCQVCGYDKAIAHHDDYDKPLIVRWLCRSHHGLWHRDNRPLHGE